MNVTIAVLAASVMSFAATNIDDIVLLTLFFAKKIPTRRIVAGQYLGFAAIVLLSCFGALLALAIPTHWSRLLGLLPLALGIKALGEIGKTEGVSEPSAQKPSALAIALITLSNGADNVGVYVPFFRLNSHHLWLILIVYAVLVGVWCLAARGLGRHPVVLGTLDRVGHWLVPFVFIGLGVYILAS
jgi:cadmium resistance protein CadD (predicted permease)